MAASSAGAAPRAMPACGMLDLLPPELLRKVVERCCCFGAEEESDPRTTKALLGTCRALGRLVMASAPRRTLTFRLDPQQLLQQEWPAGLTSLVLALSPPDVRLAIRSSTAMQYARLPHPPPQPLWPFITSLHLHRVAMAQQELAALQLHQWPSLVELEVEYCSITPSDPPATHLLQPLPHLHTLRVTNLTSAEYLRPWVSLAGGPSLRVLGLHSGEHLGMFPSVAEQVTHVELEQPRDVDIKRLAQLPQLQHVSFGNIHFLEEDLTALQCPWTSMCLEECRVDRLLRLLQGPPLQALTMRSVSGPDDFWIDDPDSTISVALSKLRQHQDTLSVVVEGWGSGTWEHSGWGLGRRERLVGLRVFNAELLRWVLASCTDSVGVLHLAAPISSWAEAQAPLQESGRVHTLCLATWDCSPEVAAALPACIHHIKVRGSRNELEDDLAPFVAALPASVQRLSLLCQAADPPDLTEVEAARVARQAPLVLSVRCDERP